MDKFLKEFKDRGYFYQCTNENELSKLINKEKIKGYIGFDCTAESLHVGSLLQIMCLRLLQKYGHRPIVLLGGGTTRIGDPSGKDKTRKILTEKEIDKNTKNIEKILKKFLNNNDPKTKPIFVNNYSWLKNLNYISFLREIGKHFTINKMLTFDSVKNRLDREQSLSYMEFNYMILQAFDFYQLFKTHNCILQVGGSDQWGNIVNGVDLIKRHSSNQVFGLTTPLITLSSGLKMGKTEKGAIWLDSKFLPAYEYWQFWRNTNDEDVIRFLKMFTDLDTDLIDNKKDENINDLKILLANETTSMLHGNKAALNAEKTARETFEKGNIGKNLPSVNLSKGTLKNGVNILDFIVITKLLNSKSEVRRVIKNRGIKINNSVVDDDKLNVNLSFFVNNICKISFGKKKHLVVKLI